MRRLTLLLLAPLTWMACEDNGTFSSGTFALDAGGVSLTEGGAPSSAADAAPEDASGFVPQEGTSDAGTDAEADAGFDAGPNPVSASPLSGITAEDGTGFDVHVAIARTPTATVTLPVVVSRPDEATVSVASVVFSPTSGTTATIAVRGIDDGIVDADQPFTVTIGPPSSTDPTFRGHPAIVIEATNRGWVQLFKNIAFDVAPGVTIDLDAPGAFPADYIANGGWVGSPNPPFETTIADGYGRDGTRGARLIRPAGTDGTYLPAFEQSFAVAATEQTCTYRARADVRADVDTARLRLLLELNYANGVHAAIPYTDSTAAVGTWQTLTAQQAGPAVNWTTATVIVGASTAGYLGEAHADNVQLDRVCKN